MPFSTKQFRLGEAALMIGFPFIGTVFAFCDRTAVDGVRILVFGLGTYCLFLSIYAFNSFCGYAGDVNNVRFAGLHRSEPGTHLLFAAILLPLSVIVYRIGFGWEMAVMGGGSFLLWMGYSLPGIGLKNFPLTGTCIHLAGQILHFQMGYAVLMPVSTHSVLVSVYFALLFAAGHLHHELIDYEADRKAGIRTGAAVFGPRGAIAGVFAAFTAAAIYWTALWRFGHIRLGEFLPFGLACMLQLSTMGYLAARSMGALNWLTMHQKLYRLYYLSAGVCVIIYRIAALDRGAAL